MEQAVSSFPEDQSKLKLNRTSKAIANFVVVVNEASRFDHFFVFIFAKLHHSMNIFCAFVGFLP